MACLLLPVLLPLCSFVIWKRRRQGWAIVVPAVTIPLVLFASGLTLASLLETFGVVAAVRPEDKATILAAGIAEAMRVGRFWLPPALVGLFLIDLFVRRKASQAEAAAQPLR
jgi:hypothetical protein